MDTLNLAAKLSKKAGPPHWTPAKTPRFKTAPVIHSVHWTESFDAPTQPFFAGGTPRVSVMIKREIAASIDLP
jgi:hypothetical protein